MSPQLLATFIITEFILCLTPGPAVLLVTSQAVRYGARRSCFGSLGVVAGNAFYFAVAAAGLGAVILASTWLYDALRIFGAIYLMVLGFKMVRQAFLPGAGEPTSEVRQTRSRHLFLQAFLMQLANPKAILFFVALLPQFVDPRGNMFVQCFILAVVSGIIELPVLFTYGWLAGRGRNLSARPAFTPIVEGLGGTLIFGLGVKLAFTRR